MRNYTPSAYEMLVENIQDETLQRYMREEQEFIAGVESADLKTFIDLGAGHGRAIPFLASLGKGVVAIEINPDMFQELVRRSANYANATVVKDDFLTLPTLLPESLTRPVFLILQNSLGTIEGGIAKQVLDVVRNEAIKRQGELVLSLFRQPALEDWGVSMYAKMPDMVGVVDKDRSDFKGGSVVTDTGYTSKWWTDEEIETFRQLGRVVRDKQSDAYELLHLVF